MAPPVVPKVQSAVTVTPPTARRSSSSSSTASSRRHTASPPTSRPTSTSRSPPGGRASTGSSSPRGSASDSAKMPPPPPPPQARQRRVTRTQSMSMRARTEEEKLAGAAAASKSLGNVLGVRSSVPSLKTTTSDPARMGRALSVRGRVSNVDKEKEKEKGKSGGTEMGRTMSMRSRTVKEGSGSGSSSSSTVRARAATGSSVRQRPAGATRDVANRDAATGTAGIRRPSTSSVSASASASASVSGPASGSASASASASMPPPPVPRGHRRSASNATSTATALASNARPTTANSTKTKRPAFTALTQDYSTPSNPTAPPSPRSRIIPPPPLDTPTIHAQTQLLQLLTLHSSSGAVYQHLIASATATLKSRFEQLSARHYDARATTLKKQKRHNLDSLASVFDGRGGSSSSASTPEQRVQAFSEAIKRIDATRTGEFRRLCAVFGEWISGYSPRCGGSAGNEKWVDGIGAAWRRECAGVCRRLEVSIRGVEGVAGVLAAHGEVEAVVTTVGRVAEGYRGLAAGMLEEVEMMGRMEGEVVERERSELRRRVQEVLEVEVGEVQGRGVWAC